MNILGIYHYWVFAILLMIGFYAVIAKLNLIKKLIGLSLFQAAVFLLYITMGNVEGASAPIFGYGAETFSNPLPQVLILTAIVVGISTMALGLGLVVRSTKYERGRSRSSALRDVVVVQEPPAEDVGDLPEGFF